MSTDDVDIPCYIGGPVDMRTLTVVHECKIRGAAEIIKVETTQPVDQH